jgi:hypothetical protein
MKLFTHNRLNCSSSENLALINIINFHFCDLCTASSQHRLSNLTSHEILRRCLQLLVVVSMSSRVCCIQCYLTLLAVSNTMRIDRRRGGHRTQKANGHLPRRQLAMSRSTNVINYDGVQKFSCQGFYFPAEHWQNADFTCMMYPSYDKADST